MIKVDNIYLSGFDAALRGMRNPLNSWDKSDSGYCCDTYCENGCPHNYNTCSGFSYGNIVIGESDLGLMKRLFKAGTEHRKYLRMIHVQMDITAPLYWWKEFDTYKVGTTSNSCSTMHKIQSKEFTLDDFSHEHLMADEIDGLAYTINRLNVNRNSYNEFKDKRYWWNMIQLLPSSYNQRRTIDMNYETVFNIIQQRANHKLDEWIQLVKLLNTLPYVSNLLKE